LIKCMSRITLVRWGFDPYLAFERENLVVIGGPILMARDDIRGWASRHLVASFFTLAYAISWLGWLPAVLGYRGDLDQILSMIAQFGPAVAALVLAWARQIVRWRVALRWRAHLSDGSRGFLANLWPWTCVAGVIAWLLVLPGTILIDYFLGVNGMDFIFPILAFTVLSAFGLRLLTLVNGFAYDVQRRIDLHKTPRWVTRATS
jgi:hypothetical protein